ncbi:MAG TPA: DUF3035 domain-containing protein [Acetobacteraceae bacterium]|nr:DUF3035 domain-containing protein [Acetobacteraceae bacterium]
MVSARPRLFVLAACACVLAACSHDQLQRNFGLVRDAPDEFVVTTRAPLSVPPDFALRPPQPGAPRPQEMTPTRGAEAALVPQTALAPAAGSGADSPGQEALVAAAGPPAPSDIRHEVDVEAAKEATDRSLTDSLMFWRKPAPPGVVVDPQKEAERLRENAALGKSPETGDTPVLNNKPKTLFNSLF